VILGVICFFPEFFVSLGVCELQKEQNRARFAVACCHVLLLLLWWRPLMKLIIFCFPLDLPSGIAV
jgi:hypothetical protein